MPRTTYTIHGRSYESLEAIGARLDELRSAHPGDRYPKHVGDEVQSLEAELAEHENRVRADLVMAAYNRGAGSREEPPAAAARPPHRETSELRSQALRANEGAEFLPDDCRAHMERTIREDADPLHRLERYAVAASDREYFRAFSKLLNDPVSGAHLWTPEERAAVQHVREEMRAIGLGSQGGAFLVPYELDPNILIANAGAVNPMREVCRVDTTSLNTKKYVTSVGVTATWTPEATEQTDDSPTLLQPSIDCKKGAAFVPVSIELFEDSDIARQIGRVFADAKANHEALSYTLTQTNGPVGLISALVAAGGSTVIATGTNVLAQADLYANQAALPARWRASAKWMMNLSIINGFRQLPQATGLNYSVVDDSGPRPKALGWEIHENSSMDGTLSGGAADYLVLSGDFQQFVIVDRIGSSLELVPHLLGANRRPTGQRGFYLHWRTGSDVLIADAFRLSNYST